MGKGTSTPMVSGSPTEEGKGSTPPVKLTKKIMKRRMDKALPTNEALKPNSDKVTTFKNPGFKSGGLTETIDGGYPRSPSHVINVNVHPAVTRKLQTVKKK
jgi:hypothetical protein